MAGIIINVFSAASLTPTALTVVVPYGWRSTTKLATK